MHATASAVAVARMPIGKLPGCLSALSAAELGGTAIRAALQQAWISGAQVDAVIMGNVMQGCGPQLGPTERGSRPQGRGDGRGRQGRSTGNNGGRARRAASGVQRTGRSVTRCAATALSALPT